MIEKILNQVESHNPVYTPGLSTIGALICGPVLISTAVASLASRVFPQITHSGGSSGKLEDKEVAKLKSEGNLVRSISNIIRSFIALFPVVGNLALYAYDKAKENGRLKKDVKDEIDNLETKYKSEISMKNWEIERLSNDLKEAREECSKLEDQLKESEKSEKEMRNWYVESFKKETQLAHELENAQNEIKELKKSPR